MKLYVISGLGADFKVLERLTFPENIEVEFIPWRIPLPQESFANYVNRMAENINTNEDFCLLGYSFGGILVQEINKLKPAQKVIILGSIKSSKEKSNFIKSGSITKVPKMLPTSFYSDFTIQLYSKIRRKIDPKNPKILQYFRMRDPYYLKWSIEKICDWNSEENPNTIQILGDKDIVFPIKNSHPDYVIKGGTHLFPATKAKEVSLLLKKILN